MPQEGKVRRQEKLKYFAVEVCWSGKCPHPQAALQEVGSPASPLVCKALSEVIVDRLGQPITPTTYFRTHQMEINPWTSFALLNLNLHLYTASLLSVRPNCVLTCSKLNGSFGCYNKF